MSTAAKPDRVQLALQRFYERHGSRGLVRVAFGVAVATVFLVVPVTVAAAAGYLDASTDEAVRWVVYAEAVAAVAVVGGVLPSRHLIRTIAVWSDEPTEARAAGTWQAIERAPRKVVPTVALSALLLECAVMPAVITADVDAPGYVLIMIAIGVTVAVAADAIFVVFLLDVVLRPIMAEVATRLPPGFEPPLDGWRLRTKAVVPTPFVTALAALFVGAFADTAEGPPRMVVTFAIALAVCSVATAIFVIASGSALRPLDEVMAATHRVRDGDLETEAPLLTTDELGELTLSFNKMLEGLRERESLQEHNAELVDELRDSRARIVAASDAARRRVERDLHDGAQQHLVLLQLKLGQMAQAVAADPKAAAMADELRADLTRALRDLRELAHGLYPALLENEGLPGALNEAADRAAIPAEVQSNGTGRYPPEIEAAVYFCCLEALQNAAKHAGPDAVVKVTLSRSDAGLEFSVADTGPGFDVAQENGSHGLQNMRDRIGALGGALEITSVPGQGTTVSGTVPGR
jgi:signal transduction histidine kinase